MKNFCYLASVYDGERIRVTKIERSQIVHAGDLLRLSDKRLASVTHVIFVEDGGNEYQFIAAGKPIEDDWIEFYRYGGIREVINEPT